MDITILYKGSVISTMQTSGTKTLETSGKYCEGDITVVYSKQVDTVVSSSAWYLDSNNILVM